MKKIAIMTWYKYRNFGTILQCTALSYKLRLMGYDPTVISYDTSVNKYVFPEQESFINTVVNYVSQRFTPFYSSFEREEKFREFINKRICESDLFSTYSELYELNKSYDTFICGSDQIWSPTRSFDDKYFLSFVSDNNKKISYAPSFGTTIIYNDEQKEIISGLLRRFDSISVREKTGAKIVEDLIGYSPRIVLDPTLLLNSKEWDEYAEVEKCEKISGDYILCYFLGNEKKYIQNVRKISHTLGMPYYCIPVTGKESKKVDFAVGPSEFVSLIKHAKYVCTDSFHGIIFSINFGIPFSAYRRFKDSSQTTENSRIYDMLDELKLSDRIGKECYKTKIDYTEVFQNLERLRKASCEYLTTAIEKETNTNIFYVNSQMCAGCKACETVCSKKCIQVLLNEDGFYQRKIETSKCINCGLCKKVCPIINSPESKICTSEGLYSAVSKDTKVLQKSSSGGVGYELASYLLTQGYTICGVTYDADEDKAKHVFIDSTEDLPLIQGTKYLQSDIGKCFEIIVNNKEKKYAFFGTPCQTAGLNNALKMSGDRDRVLLIDLVCHGITSMSIWEKYIKEQKKKYGLKKIYCVFRNKLYSWKEKYISLLDSSNREVYCASEKDDLFYAFFNRPIVYAPTCYECQFRKNSSADIRIGDFWGDKYKDNKEGVSLVVTVTKKGEQILQKLDKIDREAFNIGEYEKAQYLVNPQKNIQYKAILKEAQDQSISMKELAERHIAYYVMREKMQKYKNLVNTILKSRK